MMLPPPCFPVGIVFFGLNPQLYASIYSAYHYGHYMIMIMTIYYYYDDDH